MAFEVFHPSRSKGALPLSGFTIRVGNYSIGLNLEASRLFSGDQFDLLWERDSRTVGIKGNPSGPFRSSPQRNGLKRINSVQQFYRHIGILGHHRDSEYERFAPGYLRHDFAVSWDRAEELLAWRLPKEETINA